MITKLEEQKRSVWCLLNELEQMHNALSLEEYFNHYVENGQRFSPMFWVDFVCALKKHEIKHDKEDVKFSMSEYSEREYMKSGPTMDKIIVAREYLADYYQEWLK